MRKVITTGGLLLMGLFQAVPATALWETPDEERDGWKQFAWYGWVYESGTNWIYHADHGWLYTVGDSTASIWFYDPVMGWHWSGKGTYPYAYLESQREWLTYFRGSHDPERWHHAATGQLLAIHERAGNPVTREPGTYDWRHREYFATEENVLEGWTRNVVTTTLDTQVIENDLIRVTLLPGWGARILSILYKPGNIELLSYAKGDKFSDIIHAPGAFYYDDWLLLPGGINPTFPEGEHGKYWGLPWEFSVIEETAGHITVRMSRQDDIDWPGTPPKFNNGLTGMIAEMDITVFAGRACTEITYTLINTRDETIAYEFWTAASLAPLPPDQTATSSNLEIVMNQKKIVLRDWWNWMAGVETDDGNPADDVYQFDALAWLYNWKGSGIAYAWPVMDDAWWGVINHDYDWGVLRTTDDPANAPGMKIWGTGADYGMFELWSGNSPEFFVDAFLAPEEVKSWKETFIPTVGLPAITTATAHGAVYAERFGEAAGGYIDLSVFSTWQPANWDIEIRAVTGEGQSTRIGRALLNFSTDEPTEHIRIEYENSVLPQEPFLLEGVATDFFTGEERLRFTVD